MSGTDRDFQKFIKTISAANASQVAVERALYRIGSLMSAQAKINAPVDFGHLMNSIFYQVEMDKNGNGGVLTIGSRGVPYASIHEFGGTIRPRNSGALTIPIANWAKRHRASDFRLIRIGRLLVDPTRLRKGEDKIPDDAKAFYLTYQVNIKAKRYIGRAIDKHTPHMVEILRGLGNGK